VTALSDIQEEGKVMGKGGASLPEGSRYPEIGSNIPIRKLSPRVPGVKGGASAKGAGQPVSIKSIFWDGSIP